MGEFPRFYGAAQLLYSREKPFDSTGSLPAPRNRSITKLLFKDSFMAHYFGIGTIFSKQRHCRLIQGEFLSFDGVAQAARPLNTWEDSLDPTGQHGCFTQGEFPRFYGAARLLYSGRTP